MRKTIISCLAILAFAFSLFISASPPVAAETGKSVKFQSAQTAQVNLNVVTGDIPISAFRNHRKAETGGLIRPDVESATSVAINYGQKRSRQIATKDSLDTSESLNPPESFGTFQFINDSDSVGGFSGFAVKAREKI